MPHQTLPAREAFLARLTRLGPMTRQPLLTCRPHLSPLPHQTLPAHEAFLTRLAHLARLARQVLLTCLAHLALLARLGLVPP
ncbi:hypothetical protein [Streptomyces monomycini]|uniref:hypothetical protein n=1 Tax=Streptomyces monomycini TaxID=371720 RepID=UPI001AD83E03|nr:hypothetical protein [Streptomyces monomycini]